LRVIDVPLLGVGADHQTGDAQAVAVAVDHNKSRILLTVFGTKEHSSIIQALD
jgi:hypothetical protein